MITLEEELKVYKEALRLHKKDIIFSKDNWDVSGMCYLINRSLDTYNFKSIEVIDLKRFMKLKPNNKSRNEFWWSTKNTNTTRLKKFKQLIAEVEQEIEDKLKKQ